MVGTLLREPDVEEKGKLSPSITKRLLQTWSNGSSSPVATRKMFEVFQKSKEDAVHFEQANDKSIEDMIEHLKKKKIEKNMDMASTTLKSVPENPIVVIVDTDDENENEMDEKEEEEGKKEDEETKEEEEKKLPPWKQNRYEPDLICISEEEDDDNFRRKRSDTIYTENLSPLGKLIRHEMECFARYRCLTLVQKVPSNKLHSKYYTTRPYLLAYTRWLASEGIYQSTSIMMVPPKRASCMMIGDRRGSLLPGLGKRVSLLHAEAGRRGSLTPSSHSFRRGSLTPSTNSGGRRQSLIPSKINAKKDKKSKKSLFSALFGCLSSKKKNRVQRDLERLEKLHALNKI